MRSCCGMIISVTCSKSDFVYTIIWDGKGLPNFPPTLNHERELDLLCHTFFAYNLVIQDEQKTIDKLENALCEYFDKGIIAGQLACLPEPPPLKNFKHENCDYFDLMNEDGSINEMALRKLDSIISKQMAE